jgi:parvulin-like peptidyl-prolyl isomerase
VQRKDKRFAWLLALIAGALLIAGCSGGTESPDNTVAASVNGKKIMLQEVERVIHQQAQGKESSMSAHDLAQARIQVLDTLIQREVLFQRAEQEKLLPTEEEITTSINTQKQQSGMTDEEFNRQLKEQGMTNEALREESKKDLAIKRLQDKYAGKITISDREVEDFYNANRASFVNARGVGLAVIIVDPSDNSADGILNDAKGDTDAKAKIDRVYQQLKGGSSDFATVARTMSEDPNSLLKGGDIGFFTEDRMKQTGFPADLISKFMGDMQVGSFTEPRQMNNRWYIFKLQDKRLTTENLTLESPNVRQQITVELTDQRKNILDGALLRVATSEAKIVNNLASGLLVNPSNLGLRPAESNKPTSSPAAPSASSAPATPAKPSTNAAPTASPAKK